MAFIENVWGNLKYFEQAALQKSLISRLRFSLLDFHPKTMQISNESYWIFMCMKGTLSNISLKFPQYLHEKICLWNIHAFMKFYF